MEHEYFSSDTQWKQYQDHLKFLEKNKGNPMGFMGGKKVRDEDYLNNLNDRLGKLLWDNENQPKHLFNMPGNKKKKKISKKNKVPNYDDDDEFEFLGKY